MDEFPVKVFIYDISKGLARGMSMALLGKQIDGIWHTGIVVHGQEFFFGGDGINSCQPRGTVLGPPDTVVDLGTTQIPADMFMDYLSELSQTSFRPECYHLLNHNCNNFSSELAQFLTGNDIPAHITNLPAEVLQTPMGAMLKAFIDNMSSGHPMFGGNQNANARNEVQATSTSSTPKPVEKEQSTAMSATKKSVSDSIVTYRVEKIDFSTIKDVFKEEDEDCSRLQEICEYINTENCSWSIGKAHIDLLEKLLACKQVKSEKKVKVLEILQSLVLSEDTIHLLNHYNTHGIMEYACNISQYPRAEQTNIMKMFSNCCQSQIGVDWLTSLKEYSVECVMINNCRITGGCCVYCLLQENQDVRQMGAALSYNLTMYKLSEDSAVEIGSAILQCLMGDLTEVSAFHCLSALKTLMSANQEVTDLACVMGVDTDKFKTMSTRIEQIAKGMEAMLM